MDDRLRQAGRVNPLVLFAVLLEGILPTEKSLSLLRHPRRLNDHVPRCGQFVRLHCSGCQGRNIKEVRRGFVSHVLPDDGFPK